jgi:PAS domain S-box-containing protein
MTSENSTEALQKRISTLEKEVRRYKNAWETLDKGEKLFTQIVTGSPIATFVIDMQHRILTCNSAYEKLTGIPAEEIIGTDNQWKTFYAKKRSVLADFIVDMATEETIAAHYGQKYRKSPIIEGAYEAEDYFPALSDSGKWLYFTAAPLKDTQGNIIGALETLQDITEQKQTANRLIESEKRIRIFFEFVPYPIVIFTHRGRVYYSNPAFSKTFGWTKEEIQGGSIPWNPPGMADLPAESIETFFGSGEPRRYETRRLTKDGRIIDVIVRAVSYSSAHGKAAGVLMIQRDVTREKREARINEVMHRISLTLPAYPDLKELLDFIVTEVRQLLAAEIANLLIYDEERNELVFFITVHENHAVGQRINETRFPINQLMAGDVIKTGRPIIDNHASESGPFFKERDAKLGYRTKNVALAPVRSGDRIIGVLAAANKKDGLFEQSDIELLNTIGSTVALSIENARYSSELQKAYQEVRSLNIAKGKLIHHLSHELKTPVAILSGSMSILAKQLAKLPDTAWQKTLERVNRNLNRIVEIQSEVSDIVQIDRYEIQTLLSRMLDQCADELETLVEEETEDRRIVESLKQRIDDTFGPKDLRSTTIHLKTFVEQRLQSLKPHFAHRNVQLIHDFDPAATAFIPPEALEKIVDGLVKNAIENTPDGGKIELSVQQKGKGAALGVRDYGIGILEDAKKRIFEGFFPTRDTLSYSSKRPFDFNAGGKGADLLRMKIFSERYNFSISMSSTRCRVIPEEENTCPGDIHDCPDCTTAEDCYGSGGTTFSLYFPPHSQ